MANGIEFKAHHLINKERTKKGLAKVQWSHKMYKLAKEHSHAMARKGHLYHSARPALKGGENCWWGQGINYKSLSASMVKGWMKSPGHRAWILDSRVKTAAIGISSSKNGTYAAWSFSDEPKLKPFKTQKFSYNSTSSIKLQNFFKILLLILSVFIILLGLHGIYVYFSRVEVLFSFTQLDNLFLVIKLPTNFIQAIIEWMSLKAIQSLFFPIVFIISGLFIFVYSKNVINFGPIKSRLLKHFK